MAISSLRRDSATGGANSVANAAAVAAPRRVLFIDHTATLGGGEIALFNLATHLNARLFQPIVLLCSHGALENRLKDAGIETHVLPLAPSVVHTRKDTLNASSLFRLKDVARIFRYILSVSAFIRRNKIDIVHTNSLKADIIGGIAARLAAK